MFKINTWTTIPGNDPFNSLLTKLRFGLDDIEECFNHFKSFNESQINNSFGAVYKQSNLLADAKSVDNQPLNLETRLTKKRLGTRRLRAEVRLSNRSTGEDIFNSKVFDSPLRK